ncbi:hypothetical protein SBOR_4987 [Sclerotinia borealis F-4128]|uniref:DUF1750-domain-containing protein n=1 Tax=Sclerotinia borealis (strain F-4128) TaxID=1432307 RepID=W9CJD4_SCLBF|nr:hypothetical protein SBOR_4987 [Sclerotinia borealis F-4128]
MPSFQPKTPSSPIRKRPSIVNKTIAGGISKKMKKSGLSPKSPSAISPDRLLRGPKSRQLAALLRGIQAVEMQNVLEYFGPAEPEPMDTREDYEWDCPGFDGYLLQEYSAKIRQFPEMALSAEAQILYALGLWWSRAGSSGGLDCCYAYRLIGFDSLGGVHTTLLSSLENVALIATRILWAGLKVFESMVFPSASYLDKTFLVYKRKVMQDPSQGIHRDLLHHVHLLSTYRFPITPSQLHPERVAEWLINAPKITRDQAPVYWTYLDRPVDGTVLLSWQTPTLGQDYPSDGYIWGPGETAFSLEVMGCTLEIYHCKIGYGTGETIASHTRRRYRLVPRNPNQNPMPDPNLWIIHYTQAAPEDRLPSHIIPINQQIQNTMSTRHYLHQQGQLIHKEFSLHDRANWAKIDFPRGHPRGAPIYAASIPPRVPQSMAYPTQPQPGPPSKRARTANVVQPVAANVAPVILEEDEEENSRGDWFDLTTPREISYSRFHQNYSWMEEVLSSPYAINQIVPTDLGLGVHGELSSLTEGIFNAPLKETEELNPALNYVGRLDPSKAEEFRKRAHDSIAQTNKDMEKMKAKHAKRLAKFQKSSLIAQAEKELRTAVDDPLDIGPEYWRLEGRIDEEENEDAETPIKTPSKVDDVLAKVEASLGRHAVAISELRRIQDGGFEEVTVRASSPPSQTSRNGSQQSGVLMNESDAADVDMTNSTAGLLDQFHRSNSSSHATPVSASYPTPGHLQHPSAATTPAGALHMASPHLSQTMGTPQAAQQNLSPPQQEQQDVHMQDSISTAETQQPLTATAAITDTSDWVVVPPGGVSPTADHSNTNMDNNATNPQSHDQQSHDQHSALSDYLKSTSDTNTPEQPLTSNSLPEPQLEHPQEQEEEQHHIELNENDFDLEDLDTAGHALASYDTGDVMEDDHHGLGDLVDDSAFGDAFHGIDHHGGDADGDSHGI